MENKVSHRVKNALKIYISIFGFYILISVISLATALSRPFDSLVFLDGLRQLFCNFFYVFIGYHLYYVFYSSEKILNNLVSSASLKRMTKIWYCLVGLLVFKITTLFLIKRYVIPFATDRSLADGLGYSAKMAVAPYSDLLISILIVWVFLYLINYALKLKQENDLTI
ncbi:hypothetical protein [Pedobacter rhodius]|uniref:DUF2975 domain-containing protein n=1 Tax=Pedobacter rhodius TaxID=3004098 RepID=A0ABT4KWU0_9SPHI|nr:hypothetical protein [Pedobacter sp. SJ11]MCZ4223395.1 hypothetical protein [Pedobacter sp. SJ11]